MKCSKEPWLYDSYNHGALIYTHTLT